MTKTSDKPDKQAVIVIHGMGEQVPMATLRGFVRSVWETDHELVDRSTKDPDTGDKGADNPVWSKPDRRNRSHELHRITTEFDVNGRRTDFYEYYWAHLMSGSTWEHFTTWFYDILLRTPKRVPRDVFHAWIMLWVITLAIIAFVVFTQLFDDHKLLSSTLAKLFVAVVTLLVAYATNKFLIGYFGDVARYVKANPVNIARRQEIREKGVELFETVMGVRDLDGKRVPQPAANKDWATKYDRIIVVSHSLGTIVAYDILKACFARNRKSFLRNGNQPVRHEMEEMLRTAIAGKSPLDLNEFRRKQDACRQEFTQQGSPWIISDFITLGSPLTHVEFLMAESEQDVLDQQKQRILPTCPPVLERDESTGAHHFSYWPFGRAEGEDPADGSLVRLPHHAALFAYTKWTNIYSRRSWVLWGDQISGPVAEHFALRFKGAKLKGIKDIQVMPQYDKHQEGKPEKARGRTPFFTHTKYWDASVRTRKLREKVAPYHIVQLRKAINLLRKPDTD